MAIIIEMPKLSDTMSEGKILAWRKKEGEAVQPGDIVAEIESDKANMEMEAYDAGILGKVIVPEGGSAPVGAPIAIVRESAGEDITALVAKLQAGYAGAAPKPAAGAAQKEAPRAEPQKADGGQPPRAVARAAATPAPAAGGNGRGRIAASPLAVRMAAELGLDLAGIRGSGPEGRIVKRDILAASAAPQAQAQPAGAARAAPAGPASVGAVYAPPALEHVPQQSHRDQPVSSMRRIIAERLTQSKADAPHFYVTVDVDMKAAIKARAELNAIPGVNVTFNDLVVKAVALTLVRHPALNAAWHGDAIRHYKSVDIGVAVALPEGLITPVVRACHLKSLGRISHEIKELAEKARAKKLTPDDYQGGTFTISNLGMFGVKQFTAILNPPQACILAVGGIQDVPVVENGAVVPGHRLSLTLSSDHRAVDGAQAAQFLRDLKQGLESPVSLSL